MFRGSATPILSGTWANRPSTAANNILYFASDAGEYGTLFQYIGSRWHAVNGRCTQKFLTAAVTGVANSETIVLQNLFPIASWQTGDIIRISNLALSKSGNTDTCNVTVRIGTAGTTADTAVTGLSAFAALSAAALNGGFNFDIKLISATSAQKIGNNASNVSSFGAGGTTAIPAATTITDASANALYVSVGIASSGATNTVAITGGAIELVTP